MPYSESLEFAAENRRCEPRALWNGSFWERAGPLPRRLARWLLLFPAPRRIDLAVPFAEKDAAKALGAKWDATARKWFCPEGADAARFTNWLPFSEPLFARIVAAVAGADQGVDSDDDV